MIGQLPTKLPVANLGATKWKIALLAATHIVAGLFLAGAVYTHPNPAAPPPLPSLGLIACEPTGEPIGVGFRGKQPLVHANGIGADDLEHSNWLYWDAEKQVFSGASQLRHGQLPAFEVDLSQSEGFVATDVQE